MKVLAVLAIVAFVGIHANPTLTAEQQWTSFKLQHGKTYTSHSEEVRRLGIFQDTLKRIHEHNALYEQGLVTYTLGVTKFADMTTEERRSYSNYKSPRDVWQNINIVEYQATGSNVPTTVDWRTSGAVTEPKVQGNCGACWSFSATGAMEAQYFFKTGKLVSLSEQNLMDCSTSEYNNDACNGGNMYGAFAYVINNQGIDSEASYPYEEAKGQCRYNAANNVTTLSYIQFVKKGDEVTLKEAVSALGPISVAMDAEDDLYDYNSGVYENSSCSSTNLNHGVLLVGYGNENGQDYWLIKNSWSAQWGEQGYLKIARGNNNCGIATDASIGKL